MSRRRNGFTLIELLVVIAIILVLAAILFPVLAAAPKSAQKANCASNMKQLALGIANYCSDWGGRTPLGCAVLNGKATGYTSSSDTTWTGNDGTGKIGIYRYVKSAKLFVCPTVNDTMRSYFPQSGGRIITTYALNFRFMAGGANCPTTPFLPNPYIGQTQTLDAPPQPSRTILLIESMASGAWLGDGAAPVKYPSGGGCVIYSDQGVYGLNIRWFDYPQVPFGHSGGCNVAFADGHTKFIKAPKVGPGYPAYPPTRDADSVICQNSMTWWPTTP